MSHRAAIAAAAVVALGLTVWHQQLFIVSDPGERPRALALRAPADRVPTDLDVVLPAVPVGARRLGPGRVLIVHYWAPWERDGLSQAAALDSLSRREEFAALSAVVVSFDPFPSVARYLGRHRLRLTVLLDHRRALGRALPCPSVPYTYVLDPAGRIAVAQAGEVDWLSRDTLRGLRRLLGEAPG